MYAHAHLRSRRSVSARMRWTRLVSTMCLGVLLNCSMYTRREVCRPLFFHRRGNWLPQSIMGMRHKKERVDALLATCTSVPSTHS